MRPKSLLLLALALGCGLVASIGISQMLDSNASNNPQTYETAPIYIALHNINLGDPIDGSMVTLQEWPKDKIPPGAITELEDLEGRRPRTSIIEGEPILDAKLLAVGQLEDPISKIPKNMRLKTVSVDAKTSAAGLLAPGDRVDVQLFVARNPTTGIDQTRTRIILQDIRVFAVDQTVQRSADGEDTRAVAKTISLILTPEQANKIALAEQVGTLSLIPRSPNDDALVELGETSLDDLLGNGTNEKNSRELEQNRDGNDEQQGPVGGLISGLLGAMRKNIETPRPFTMEILRGEEYELMEFDPFTGRPLNPKQNEREKPAMPSSLQQTVSDDEPAEEPEIELPDVDFPIDFPLE